MYVCVCVVPQTGAALQSHSPLSLSGIMECDSDFLFLFLLLSDQCNWQRLCRMSTWFGMSSMCSPLQAKLFSIPLRRQHPPVSETSNCSILMAHSHATNFCKGAGVLLPWNLCVYFRTRTYLHVANIHISVSSAKRLDRIRIAVQNQRTILYETLSLN